MVLGFKSKKKILIVDDDVGLTAILKAVLEKSGYRVYIGHSGEEGIRMANEEMPDLIVMDINMAGLRGDLAAMRIRGEARTRSIPIIMLTAVEDVGEKVLTSQAGVADYVTKPCDPPVLLEKIKGLLS